MDISTYIISSRLTLSQAMERLNPVTVFPKNLYVVNDENYLIGSISDGDVRRGLLKNVSLSESVETVMYKSPHRVYIEDANKRELIEKFKALGMPSIPIVDFSNRIVDIVTLQPPPRSTPLDTALKENFVFILAGGEGSRLKPLTNIIPKPLIPIGDHPILEVIMDRFAMHGFGRFILSLNYKGDLIKLYFSDEKVKGKYESIEYIEEPAPLGTIGSLYYAKKLLSDDFFISNADIIIKDDMGKIMDFHKERDAAITIVGCVRKSVIPYGVLDINDNDELVSVAEKPSLKHIVNTGIYAAKPEIIEHIEENTYTDITELIEALLGEKKRVCVYRIDDAKWHDIGQWDELKKTTDYLDLI